MIEELEDVLRKHCIDMGIIKLDSPAKKVESILDSLVSAVIRSKTSIELLKDCIEDIEDDNAINLDFFNKGGNIYNYINPEYAELSYALFRQRCVGIGTPNAASGEGELLFLFMHKNIKKPTKGDLSIDNERIELKGESVRVSGKISGIDFRYKTIKVAERYGLTPNKADIKNKEVFAVELEKPQYLDYWTNELYKLSLNDQKCFVIDWLKCINKKYDDFKVLTRIFENDEFNHKNFLKEIVKILYVDMLEEGQFNILVLLGDGTDCKIVRGNSVRDFNHMIDTEVIQIESDYFRINQNFPIAYYIK
jgi:hypothetical protein